MGDLVRLCRALGLGGAPAAILEPLTALYRQVDLEVAAGAAGHALPCAAGCDACCHESVFLSAPEFLAAAAEIERRYDAEGQQALLGQMLALAGTWADELEMLETFDAGDERDEVAARIKFRCPLLSADGRCTIYAARELNGRTFGASWDPERGTAYGCSLTHSALAILLATVGPGLADARAARRRLVEAVPGTARVHVYPWWFARYGEAWLGSSA